MDFKCLLISCFVFQIIGTDSSVFYSGTVLSTHSYAETTCQSLGGNMLQYGMGFVNASLQCDPYVYIWICTPFYKQLKGCYTGTSTKRTPSDMRKADKRVGICADFCASDNYTHFGLMTTDCLCYNAEDFSQLTQNVICETLLCPGNTYDICGVDPYSIVFEKVTEYDINSCQSRSIQYNGDSHEITRYCNEKLSFWCQVGESDDVKCSFSELTTKISVEQTTASITTTSETSAIITVKASTTDKSTAIEKSTTTDKSTAIEISTTTDKQLTTTYKSTTTDKQPTTTEQSTTTDKSTKTENFTTINSPMATDKTTIESTPTTNKTLAATSATTTTQSTTSVSKQDHSSTSSSLFSTTDIRLITTTRFFSSISPQVEFTNASIITTRMTTHVTNTSVSYSSDRSVFTTTDSTTAIKSFPQSPTESSNLAIIIGVTTAGVVLMVVILIVVLVLQARKRKSISKVRKHQYPIPNVYFTNSLDDEATISYNSVRLDEVHDTSKPPAKGPLTTREPMYDQEYLVYDKQSFTEF